MAEGPSPPGEPDWRRANRANWDERVAVHLGPAAAGPGGLYDLGPLRAGRGRLTPIDEAALGDVAGLRIVHLQCHFGRDSLTLAQRGAAEVVGIDFSAAAIAAARGLAAELGLEGRARFVEADVYDAPAAVPGGEGAFDLAHVTWGTIGWLPDLAGWARVVAHFLRPGGALHLADGHPAAQALDDRAPPGGAGGNARWLAPYFLDGPLVMDGRGDYADHAARLANARTYEWMHPLGDVVGALLAAGLELRALREHDAVPWRLVGTLVPGADGLWRWPAERWLPLAYSIRAEKPRRGG